jgi:hypothetical protein
VGQLQILQLTHCLREQARSHTSPLPHLIFTAEGSGFERTLLIPFGKFCTVVWMLPGLWLFFLTSPGLLTLWHFPWFLFVSHVHLRSLKMGRTFKHRTASAFAAGPAIDNQRASIHPNLSLFISKCVSHYSRS